MTRQKAFYHGGTKRKLDAVENYLQSFLSVMAKQHYLETIYIDAFAGTGTIPIAKQDLVSAELIEYSDFAVGSALRALTLKRRFTKYLFIDQSGGKLKELKVKIAELGVETDGVEFERGDAVEKLLNLCPYLSQRNIRAVVFLDPFGNQVPWTLLEALAKTQHVDLLYLFPAMLGVYRQIGNDNAKMTPEQIASLDFVFGPNDWRKDLIGERIEKDLFGERTQKFRAADPNEITRLMIGYMKTIFKSCVLDEWLPLGPKGAHWYSLVFAIANPTPAAVKAGASIARHIMKNG